MSQKILTRIFITLLVLFGVLYYLNDRQIHKDDIKVLQTSISNEDSEDLQDFLYENHGKFVKLSVSLSPEMVEKMQKGMSEDGTIIFTAIDGENREQTIKYLLRLPDDGRRDFDFNQTSGKISGYFKTYRRVSPDGSPIINLVPIPPKLLPKEKIIN